MQTDLPLNCECGTLQGVARDVSATYKNHVVCYCDDCQLFAHFLGRTDEILDLHGGTDILQMSPANLIIEKGTDKIACMRLGPKGIYRWYADCCKTPIGNTPPSSKIPYMGMVSNILLHSINIHEREEAMGPVHMRVHTRFAKGNVTGKECHERIPLSGFITVAGKMIRWKLRGGLTPSSFFNEAGEPVCDPRVLSEIELNDAISSRTRWMEKN